MLLQPVGLSNLKLLRKSFHKINIQRKALCCDDYIENACNIGLFLDSYEPVSFKYCVMLDMTELYILIPVEMAFTQDHRFTRKPELMQSLWCKVA